MRLLLNSAEVCRKRTRAAVSALAVLLGHGVLWLGLVHWRDAPVPAPPEPRGPAIAWLAMPQAAAPAAAVAATPVAPARATPRASPRPPGPTRPDTPQAASPVTTQPPVGDAVPTMPQGAASGPLAEAPPAAASQPRLLDSAATRRAINDLARAPLNAERYAVDPIRSAADREADRIRETAKGDCNKGDYVGAGMGLLSVPFYLAAQARGDCAR